MPDLGLHCLPISHQKDARLKWLHVNVHIDVDIRSCDKGQHTRL